MILILFIVFIVAYAVNYWEESTNKNPDKISFKESMDLTELPVITFYNGNTKLNFLLDTGSNASHINKSILNGLSYSTNDKKMDVVGMEGNTVSNGVCNMYISYKDKDFIEDFIISDLDSAFGIIKKEDGVQLHGILGSKFFEKYKYVLDFGELVAYTK